MVHVSEHHVAHPVKNGLAICRVVSQQAEIRILAIKCSDTMCFYAGLVDNIKAKPITKVQ